MVDAASEPNLNESASTAQESEMTPTTGNTRTATRGTPYQRGGRGHGRGRGRGRGGRGGRLKTQRTNTESGSTTELSQGLVAANENEEFQVSETVTNAFRRRPPTGDRPVNATGGGTSDASHN